MKGHDKATDVRPDLNLIQLQGLDLFWLFSNRRQAVTNHT